MKLILTVAALLTLGAGRPAYAQGESRVGVVVLAHGGSKEWNAGVLEAARAAQPGGPVAVAFLMGPDAASHRFQDQVAALARGGATDIVVVPLLVSSHSGHYEQIRWLANRTDSLDRDMQHHLHMAGIERPNTTARLHVTRGLDDATQLADILRDRALSLSRAPSTQALFLIGHGPNSAEDYAEWMKNLRRVAERVRASTEFKDVRVDLVRDDAPAAVRAEAVTRIRELISMQARLTGTDVVVVPVLISRSSVGDEKIRRDLAGLPVKYTGDPLLPHPLMARWIEMRVRETLAAANAAPRPH